jgi:hypothetical protein
MHERAPQESVAGPPKRGSPAAKPVKLTVVSKKEKAAATAKVRRKPEEGVMKMYMCECE